MQATTIEILAGDGVIAQIVSDGEFYQWKAVLEDGRFFCSEKFLTKIDTKNNLFIYLLRKYLDKLNYPAVTAFIKNRKLSVIISNLLAKELRQEREKDPSKQLILSGAKSIEFPDGRIAFIGQVKIVKV